MSLGRSTTSYRVKAHWGRQHYPGPLLDIYRSINALEESFNGHYKTELIRKDGPWRGLDEVEHAPLEYVDWFNRRRLHTGLGRIPPAEFEAAYYCEETPALLASSHQPESRQSPGRFIPQEHWIHLRTSNPIESMFAGVLLRTDATKRLRVRENALYLVFKLATRLSTNWCSINAPNQLTLLLVGHRFVDGQLHLEPSSPDESAA